jgi:hypothetical protein
MVSVGIIAASLTLLTLTVLTNVAPSRTAPLVALVMVALIWQQRLLAWRTLLGFVLVIIFMIPIRRYSVPGNLPFEIEPYRLAIAIVLAGWIASLLVDRRVKLRPTGFEGPLLLLVGATLASVLVNWNSRVMGLGVETEVIKAITFLLSFLLVVYLITSVVRTKRDVDFLLCVMVGCGVIVSGFAMLESITGYNIFNHLSGVLSFLRTEPLPYSLTETRGARLRVYASAQHPIALSAMLVMLVPLAIYLARTQARAWIWWSAAGVLTLGAFATVSRTGVVMLIAIVVVFLWLRPVQTRRLWPVLLPGLLVIHLVLPGSLGTLKEAFFPSGGLIAQQREGAGTNGSGRIADLGPSLSEWANAPILGEGYGTRIVDGLTPNAPILDDQWLTTLLETGLVGALAWIWLIARLIKRLAREAKEDWSERGLLCTALASSVAAFAVGMLTYDAFSFVQVTFVFFVLLGLGAVVTGMRTPARRR